MKKMFQNSKYFYGYASIFNEKDLNGDIVLGKSFEEDNLIPEQIPLLYEHNQNKKIGKVLKLKQDQKGLYTEGIILHEFIPGKIMYLSIGYIPIFKLQSRNKTRYLSKIRLFEISVVKKPANVKAIAFLL